MTHIILSLALGALQQLPPPPPPMPMGGGARDNAAPRTGTSRIRGRVIAGDTGQPLRKALIRIGAPELRETRVTTSDTDGKYEFTELPAGRYSVFVSKGSYVSLSYGQLRPFESGKPLELRDGQTVEKVDFALPRGSVIAGRVVDEFGDPVAGVMVSAMRFNYIQGRRQLRPINSASTNDLGEYRIYGLAPSQYYVSAAQRGPMMMGAVMATGDASSAYAPTYFPGTPNAAEAQRISLAIGQTVADVSLALTPIKAARINGTAVNSAGQPMVGAMVMLMQRAIGLGMMGGSGIVRADGSFTMSNVTPGDYLLQARTMGDPSMGDAEVATTNVTVASGDVADVQLVAVKPVALSGHVTFDATGPAAPKAPANTLRVFVQPSNPDDMMMGSNVATMKEDQTFSIRIQPGKYVLRLVSAMPGGSGPTMKTVRVHGVEVTDAGFDVKAGDDLSGIEIEATSRQSEVSGVATDARGESVKDYTVVIFARDRERWQVNSRYQQTGRPDQDGRYKIRGLPPGEYYAVAVDYVEPGEGGDPEFLERIRPKATSFSLGDGETRTVDLKIQPTG